MELSIIIPVYNSEKYLQRCLDSVLKAIKKYDGKSEVLLIDNNSTDSSSTIIKKNHELHPEIVQTDKCRIQGAAAVRNYGVKKAKGKYVWFVDSDDTIRSDAIVRLINEIIKTKSDLIMMGMKRIYSDGHTDYLSAVCPNDSSYKSRFVRYGLGPVQLLFKREWWQKHHFRFKEGIIHEDMELMSILILYTDKYSCIDEPLYNYYQIPNSVLHKESWDPHYFDIFTALEGLYARFKTLDAVDQYYAELEWFFIWNLLLDSANDFRKFKEGHIGFPQIRRMMKSYFPKWRHNKYLKQKSIKQRLLVRINYFR